MKGKKLYESPDFVEKECEDAFFLLDSTQIDGSNDGGEELNEDGFGHGNWF